MSNIKELCEAYDDSGPKAAMQNKITEHIVASSGAKSR